MLGALDYLVAQREVERLGIDRGGQSELRKAVLSRQPLHFSHQGGADAASRCLGHDVARSQFSVCNHKGTEADWLAIELGQQPDLVIGIAGEASRVFIRRGNSPRVDDARGVMRGGETANRPAVT